MANLFQPSLARATDSNGNPLSGAKMAFYLTETTSAATVYSDADGSTAHTNPVVSDSAGIFAPVYLDEDSTYRVKLTNSTGSVTIWDVDPVAGVDAGMVATEAAAASAAASAAAASATGAASSAASASTSSTSAAASNTAAGLYAAVAEAFANGLYASTANALSSGVVSTTGIVAGSGGTNGQFDVAFSGGAGSGATARFTVAGGALTSITVVAPGVGYTSAPTMSFAASSGLSGASATAVIGQNVAAGEYFAVPGTGNTFAELWRNVAGVATDQGVAVPSLAAVTDSINKAQLRELGLPAGLTAHIIIPEIGQAFKSDTTAVAAAGDDVSTITPLGETAASAYAYNGGGTWRYDENFVPYVEMAAGTNSAQSLGTFNLTPNTLAVVALARDTDTTGGGFSIIANGGAQSINISFTAGSSQALSFSARSGSFANLNSRYGAVPLKVPTVLDFFLEAGQSSGWTNNAVRDVPDPGLLAAGVRKVANTWTGGDSYSGARWQLNLPTKGGLRFYGMVIVQGAISLTDRRTINEWLMKRCCLSQLKANSYDVFAVIGDSIALGNGDQTTSTAVPFGRGVEYLDTGTLIPLKDPMQGLWPDQVSASGSMWPAFAATWYSLKGTAACMVNCGLSSSGLWAGGDSVAYADGWLGANIMPVAARKVRYAMADVRGRLRAAIAYIGTNDRALGKTQNQLRDGFIALRDSCRTNFGVPDLPLLLISADTSSVPGDETLFSVVRAAQTAAAAYEGIYLVVPYQNWLASGHHATPTGNVHLDQFANNATGVLAATNTAAILI